LPDRVFDREATTATSLSEATADLLAYHLDQPSGQFGLTRSLQISRNSLERAIRHAESNDLVGHNVAALVKPPQGRSGRPSKSFT
jgi:hypothetical protein